LREGIGEFDRRRSLAAEDVDIDLLLGREWPSERHDGDEGDEADALQIPDELQTNLLMVPATTAGLLRIVINET
jgi:hypothetical protein